MTPAQLRQALNVRTLRANKAERILRSARYAERNAEAALRDIHDQLAAFDASLEARIMAFYAKAAGGIAPASLQSTRGFHSDLAVQRESIEALIPKAEKILNQARAATASARTAWVEASASARKLQEMCKSMARRVQKDRDRRAQGDAEELWLSRLHRAEQ